MPSTITDPGTGQAWTTAATNSLSTLTVSPTIIGDAMALFCLTTSATNNLTSVSGGGCPNSGSGTAGAWARVMGPSNLTAVTPNTQRVEMWLGRVSTTGSSTLTVAWTSAIGSTGRSFGAKQFSAGGAGTVWTADGSGGTSNNATSATVTYPSLTPTGSNCCYFGFGYVQNTGQATGQTGGYTVIRDANNNIMLYNSNVSTSIQSPTAVQSAAGTSDAWGVLITANNRPTAQFLPFFM